MKDLFMQLGSAVAGLMVMVTLFREHFPADLRNYLERHTHKLARLVYPYVEIVFPEYTGEKLKRSDVFTAIQNYLTTNATNRAKRLKADTLKDSQSLILSMDDNEEITDSFHGVRLWWSSSKTTPRSMSFSFYPTSEERRFYKLTFHKRHRELIVEEYVKHILNQGKAIASKNRQRKLYMNNPSDNWHGYKQSKWSHVTFEHPASFETLAMEKKKKEEIMKDLKKFAEGKEYYAKVGKAWKRGYLLYGPPGTGKSTMVAAMANFMNYDVYDLELTAVKDNTELKKLLIETSSKSIIIIEDIDCSLDLTGQRKKKEEDDDGEDDNEVDPAKKKAKKDAKKPSKVTLSGLLNSIDGLWSSCGGEKIIIFTTNYIDKLDPALIRRGRMDKHIEMSYCSFEAFKVLASNYLDIESHPLYPKIEQLLGETNMIPADVVENLMFKSDEENIEACLNDLIVALETAKEEARKKAEEEEAEKKAKEEEAEKKAKEEASEKKAKEEASEKKAKEEASDITARTEVEDSANPGRKLKANGTANGDLKEK